MIVVCELAFLGLCLTRVLTNAAILPDPSASLSTGFERFDKVRVDGKNFEKVRSIHVNWYNFAIKALMVQLGKGVVTDLRHDGKTQFLECLDRIADKRDLVESARCLVKAKQRLPTGKRTGPQRNQPRRHENSTNHFMSTSQRSIELFRLSRHKKRKERKHKKSKYSHRPSSPRTAYSKTTTTANHFRRDKRDVQGAQRDTAQWRVQQEDKVPQLSSREGKSPVERTYKTLTRLKEDGERRRTSPGAKVYDLRIYDLVVGNESPTIAKHQKARTPEEFMHMAVDILHTLAGDKNKDKRKETNFRFLSPRLLPVAPDKSETLTNNSILSPTILALYDESEDGGVQAKGGGQPKSIRRSPHIASLPKMLKGVGVSKHDREAILGLLMDVSGAAGIVDDAMTILKSLNFPNISDDILSTHERISAIYRTVEDALSDKQRAGMTERGFDFLGAGQMKRLYDYQGADRPEFEEFVRRHATTPEDRREDALWKRIGRIARNIPDAMIDEEERRSLDLKRKRHRFKRNSLPFSVLHPTVLAPFAFTPSIGPVVLGPVVLSPSVFSLLLLNPAVLSPYVLSPAVPIPFILSPYLLSPYVLSPLVMAPFILNPYVLSPNVLNPYLLSPLILSPSVLCPDVLSPLAVYASILSPTVASPPIYTDTFLTASVLSPSFLS